ncbi:hypothetical protein SALBM135S_02419 [Streptomyces alboniger]
MDCSKPSGVKNIRAASPAANFAAARCRSLAWASAAETRGAGWSRRSRVAAASSRAGSTSRTSSSRALPSSVRRAAKAARCPPGSAWRATPGSASWALGVFGSFTCPIVGQSVDGAGGAAVSALRQGVELRGSGAMQLVRQKGDSAVRRKNQMRAAVAVLTAAAIASGCASGDGPEGAPGAGGRKALEAPHADALDLYAHRLDSAQAARAAAAKRWGLADPPLKAPPPPAKKPHITTREGFEVAGSPSSRRSSPRSRPGRRSSS